jgi:ubiquinone/menaquinone biosynthesis C-methylase UbiE
MTKYSIRSDRSYVLGQYKSADNLKVRIRTHELYTQPKSDFISWILDRLEWTGDEKVVDVGCGAGSYVEGAVQRSRLYIAADLSLGMLQSLAKPDLDRLNLDAQRLPLASDSADVILANHMLYHLPDINASLKEISRVLRPDGVLLAATNSEYYMVELARLTDMVLRRLAGQTEDEDQTYYTDAAITSSFSLENGRDKLEMHFSKVERHDLSSTLVFPEAQPVVDYLSSMSERLSTRLPTEIPFETVLSSVWDEVTDHISENGEFRVGKVAGVFVCHNPL